MTVRITRHIIIKHRSFYTNISHREAFTQRSLCAEQLLHRSIYTQKPLHRAAFSQITLSTQSFFKQELLHRETFMHRTLTHRCSGFYTQDLIYIYIRTHKRLYTKKFLRTNIPTAFTHTEALTQKILYKTETFYTQKLLFREACKQSSFIHRSFYTQTKNTEQPLHTAAHTHRSFCCFAHTHTHKPWREGTVHTREENFAQTVLHTAAFTQRSLYTDQLLHSEDFAHRRLYTKKL